MHAEAYFDRQLRDLKKHMAEITAEAVSPLLGRLSPT